MPSNIKIENHIINPRIPFLLKPVINNKSIVSEIKSKTKIPDILSYWHTKKK